MSRELDLFHQLVRTQIEVWNAVDARVRAECGVPLSRLELLEVVRDHGGRARVQDIADMLVITVGAASKITDRGEVEGHVVRRANPDDRRSSLIEATASGRALLERAEAAATAALDERLAPLTPTQRAALADALTTLRSTR